MIHNDFLWHRTASSCQYKSVLWHNGNKLKIANAKYKNENVNLSKLYKLTQDLGKCLEEQKEI